jgi:hypothetical protein
MMHALENIRLSDLDHEQIRMIARIAQPRAAAAPRPSPRRRAGQLLKIRRADIDRCSTRRRGSQSRVDESRRDPADR